jgi:hypothetical protein
MASDFSRKHWRQRSRPYLRIKPALCEQTRLQRKSAISETKQMQVTTSRRTHHERLPLPYVRGREYQTALKTDGSVGVSTNERFLRTRESCCELVRMISLVSSLRFFSTDKRAHVARVNERCPQDSFDRRLLTEER